MKNYVLMNADKFYKLVPTVYERISATGVYAVVKAKNVNLDETIQAGVKYIDIHSRLKREAFTKLFPCSEYEKFTGDLLNYPVIGYRQSLIKDSLAVRHCNYFWQFRGSYTVAFIPMLGWVYRAKKNFYRLDFYKMWTARR